MGGRERPFFADKARDDAEERAPYVGVGDAEQARRDSCDAMEFHLARALGVEFTSSPQASAVSEPAAWACPQPSPREEGRAR